MKKNLRLVFVFLIFFTAAPFTLRAADLTVGATTWYTTWDISYEGEDAVSYGSAFLYGPVISAAFTPDLSMSFVFLYGKFDVDDIDYNEISRSDGDLAINYRIGSWIKIFAGAKYIAYNVTNEGTTIGKHEAVGPGAGVSSIIPVGGDFFILGNFSGLYLKGDEYFENSYGEKQNMEVTEYGYNASLSLAYYIQAASTTISLGGRYQQLKMEYDLPEAPESTSRFYGVTVTAVYSFNI